MLSYLLSTATSPWVGQAGELIQSYSLSSIHSLVGGHVTRGHSELHISNSEAYWLWQCVVEPVESEELVNSKLIIWAE